MLYSPAAAAAAADTTHPHIQNMNPGINAKEKEGKKGEKLEKELY